MESPWEYWRMSPVAKIPTDSNESTENSTPAVPTPGGATSVAPTIPQRFVSRPAAKRGRIFCQQKMGLVMSLKKICVGKYWADFENPTNSGFICLILSFHGKLDMHCYHVFIHERVFALDP